MNTQDKSVSNATPGPWQAGGNGYQGWLFQGGYLGSIVGANGEEVYAGPSCFHALRGKTRKQAKANAYLIAAAPELRDALQAIIEYMRDTPAASKVDTKAYALFQQGRAALSKALPPVSEGGKSNA